MASALWRGRGFQRVKPSDAAGFGKPTLAQHAAVQVPKSIASPFGWIVVERIDVPAPLV